MGISCASVNPEKVLAEQRDLDVKTMTHNGKCYVSSDISLPNEVLVFTGDPEKEKVAVDWVWIEVGPMKQSWEQKKNPDCNSDKKEDCVVWCLVEKPTKTLNYYILKDKSASQNWEVKEISKDSEVTFTALRWDEVECR